MGSTRSVYIIGGAGVGKSTFMEGLLHGLGRTMGPLVDLHSKRNAKALVTLRGHWLHPDGLYLGHMRKSYPGTDGLDRASSLTGEEWLMTADLPDFIIGEGATLSTERFLTALAAQTDLLLVHLWCEDFVRELRCMGRGSQQDERFLKNTTTRASNLLKKIDCHRLEINSADPVEWALGLAGSLTHLKGE